MKMGNKIDLQKISKTFYVKKINEEDIDVVYNLCSKNVNYYKVCPPKVTKESIRNDMYALPPNKTSDDKYFIGFYDNDNLIAIMDLIIKFPRSNTCYIGLFMLDIEKQNNGIGSTIINELFECLGDSGFEYVELGYVEENIQAEKFWSKNGFETIGSQQQELYKVICMRRSLKNI